MSRVHKLILLLAALAMGLGLLSFVAKRQAAPDLNLKSLTGDSVRLAALRGKVVLIAFWATSCLDCETALPWLATLQRRHQSQGLEALAVAMRYDQPQQVASYAFRHSLPFPVALDEDGETARRFGNVQTLPALFVLDRRGQIVQRLLGNPDRGRLQSLLDKLLAEKP